ncbi:hypothetical protein AB0K05_13170 [Nonomuraea sp. NPDC049486]|uniref:hypothetical protein n=1 Tax=Nonomuraea sp. NPDC049486 TaxID=3155773 RepID=UPI003445B3DD
MRGVIAPDHQKAAAKTVSESPAATTSRNRARWARHEAIPNRSHISSEPTRKNLIWWQVVTTPPMITWIVTTIAILVALAPVTRERLSRFAELTGLTVTSADARRIIDHFAERRRWRLITLVPAVPLVLLTDDPFYLVLGWCAVSVLCHARQPALQTEIYRTTWQLSLAGSLAVCAYFVVDREFTAEVLARTTAVLAVALAVRHLTREPAPRPPAGASPAELAIGHWSTRSLYLAGTAIVLSGALLTPGQAPERILPEYTLPKSVPDGTAAFTTARKLTVPTCALNDLLDDPCQSWQVNGEPFPQAAPYISRKGKAPTKPPFARSQNRKAVVYLGRRDRRMVYQDAGNIRPLTGPLADAAVPTATFARQNRYVALVKEGARIIDTQTWTTVSIPGVRRVHDLSLAGIVATTPAGVLVLDHRGRTRMRLPARKLGKNFVGDTYHLSPDGRRLVIVLGLIRVETYDSNTGTRVSSVEPEFGDEYLAAGLGWTEKGRFLVRDTSDRVHALDLTTGRLRKRS